MQVFSLNSFIDGADARMGYGVSLLPGVSRPCEKDVKAQAAKR